MKASSATPFACAAEMLDVVPLIMRALRAEVRKRRAPELSVPQFRALAFVGRNDGAKLSDVATFLGLTLPAASKLVDGLVAAEYVARDVPANDRRRVSLTLTGAGRAKYESTRKQARTYLASEIEHFSADERERLLGAMRDLRRAFSASEPSEISGPSIVTKARGARASASLNGSKVNATSKIPAHV